MIKLYLSHLLPSKYPTEVHKHVGIHKQTRLSIANAEDKCSNKEPRLLPVKEHPPVESYAFHITKEAVIYQHGTLSIIY